jgi:ubiquinone/menaquinone biosynthesis C-methylase UbiE
MSVLLEHADYRLSHRSADKAERYDRSFHLDPWRAHLWRREQAVLERVLREHFGDRRPDSHLDFACGTGRVLAALRGRVGASVGVDVSAEMLRVAAGRLPDARLIQADLTRRDVLGEERFDLITAFRFLANAQDSLRAEALRVLGAHLRPRGRLVFNNHKNHSSLLYGLSRLAGRTARTLSHGQVRRLAREAHLEIVSVHPLGLLPATDGRMIGPARFHEVVDLAFARGALGRAWAQDIVYVCAPRGAGQAGPDVPARRELRCRN